MSEPECEKCRRCSWRVAGGVLGLGNMQWFCTEDERQRTVYPFRGGSPQWCPFRNQPRKFDSTEDEYTIPDRYHLLANEVADLVVEKQAAYGDSFGKAGEVMRALYPDGIKPDQLDDALVVVRVIDKLFRIATDRDALGEDPWRDVMGYSLLSVGRKS